MDAGSLEYQYSEPSLKALTGPAKSLKTNAEGKVRVIAPGTPSSTAEPLSPAVELGNSPPQPQQQQQSPSGPVVVPPDPSKLGGVEDGLKEARRLFDSFLAGDTQHARGQLLERLTRLENEVQGLKTESSQWHDYCAESRRECAIAADFFEGRAQDAIRGAKESERQLVQRSRELTMQQVESESLLARTKAQARQYECELEREKEEGLILRKRMELLRERIHALEEALQLATARHSEECTRLRAEAGRARSIGAEARLEADEKAHHELRAVELQESLSFTIKQHQQELEHERTLHGDNLRASRSAHLEELQRQREGHEEQAQVMHTAHVKDMEALVAKHREDLDKERSRHTIVLREAERRVEESMKVRTQRLEEALSTANSKIASITQEAALFRAKSDQLEEANRALRYDLQEAMAHAGVVLPKPPPSAPPRPTSSRPTSSRGIRHSEAISSIRQPLPAAELTRLPRSRQLRKDILSARLERGGTPGAAATQSRHISPERSHSRGVSFAAVPPLSAERTLPPSSVAGSGFGSLAGPDRTVASGRYDQEGGLLSFNAQGRAV